MIKLSGGSCQVGRLESLGLHVGEQLIRNLCQHLPRQQLLAPAPSCQCSKTLRKVKNDFKNFYLDKIWMPTIITIYAHEPPDDFNGCILGRSRASGGREEQVNKGT